MEGDCPRHSSFIIHHSAFVSVTLRMPLEAAYCLMIVFSAAFGGCVGSFLNVVVYRLPEGLSLISPPSHCPRCKEPIHWYDNVPVFGWIMLGGKCRNCRCHISIRYPAVEAVTAAMFVALALVEGPLRAACPYAYPYHLLLLCTLLCSALIEVDGNRPPLRLFAPAMIVGIAAPLIWAIPQPAWPGRDFVVAGVLDVLAGLGAGIGLSGVYYLMTSGWRKTRPQGDCPNFRASENGTVPLEDPDALPSSTGMVLGLICTGTFLGWFSLAVVGLASLAVHAMLLLPSRRRPGLRIPPSVWLLVATITWLLVC
jgi:prepilin signal peptidase PulO-like enzyme (type II secretory pathway)